MRRAFLSRIIKLYYTSLFLLVILGPCAMFCVLLGRGWTPSKIIEHGIDDLVSSVIVSSAVGVVVSVPVSVLLARRKPWTSLTAVFLLTYLLVMAWPFVLPFQYVYQSILLAFVATAQVLAISGLVSGGWLVYDACNGNGMWLEFWDDCGSGLIPCSNCGYLLLKDDIDRCSECGQPLARPVAESRTGTR